MPRNLKCAIEHDGGKHQYNLAYDDLGNLDDPCPVFCVHGLGHTRHTFDVLADELVKDGRRVINVDLVGHGASDWAQDIDRYYIPHYAQDLVQMHQKLNLSSVNWLGVSMGALAGIRAIVEQNMNVRSFMIVDVAPEVPIELTAELADWFAAEHIFDTREEFIQWRIECSVDVGPLTDKQRRKRIEWDGRKLDDGRYVCAYDPALCERMHNDVKVGQAWDDWDLYKQITCPTMVLHGVDSPFLLAHHIEKYKTLGPKAKVIDIEGVGHYPALSDPHQINLVRKFLKAEL